MAHEHVPRCLYQHPVVEYIPLTATTLQAGALPEPARPHDADHYPRLVVLNTVELWREAMDRWPFAFPGGDSLPPPETPLGLRHDLHLVAIGFRVTVGVYRDRKCSLVAGELGPTYQLFALPLRYFYKPQVNFVVYDHRCRQVAAARGIELPARTNTSR